MIGEKATTNITQTKDAKGMNECLDASKEGGEIALNTRLELERKTEKKK